MTEFVKKALALFVLFLPLAIGPGNIEAYFWPVAKTVGMDVKSHDDQWLCVTQRLIKFRELEPKVFAWFMAVRGKPESRLQVLPYDPDSGELVGSGIVTRKSTRVQSTSRCFLVPPKLGAAIDTPIVLFAEILYRTSHGFWTVPRYIGPFVIVGMKVVEGP